MGCLLSLVMSRCLTVEQARFSPIHCRRTGICHILLLRLANPGAQHHQSTDSQHFIIRGAGYPIFTSRFQQQSLTTWAAQLFAHFVWNAAILMADLIKSDKFFVRGEYVLELGAGSGLPGLVAILQGANLVVLSDYNSSELLDNLERNVQQNIPDPLKYAITVAGHIWGGDGDSILR